MFDCVIPRQNAKNRYLFFTDRVIKSKNNKFKRDLSTLDSKSTCYTCKKYTRSYLYHVNLYQETSGLCVNKIHNLHYYQ